MGDPGGQVENVSSVSPVCRKRRLYGSVSRNNRTKGLAPCRSLDGHVKEPYEVSLAWGADHRSNFFITPAHLCAVTYILKYRCVWRETTKHLLRYWPILARSSTFHFAGAVNTRPKITVHIINLVYSEFPNRSCRSVRSFISTLNCT